MEFSLERDLDAAANDVRERLSRVAQRLPQEADPPQITKVDSGTDPIIWINVSSTQRSILELTDYMDAVPGRPVRDARRRGQRAHERRRGATPCACGCRARTWRRASSPWPTSRIRCCARTSSCPPAGSNPREREFTLRTDTNLRTEEDFRNLVVGRGPDGYLVRLGEVAEVRLASEDDRSISRSNGVIGTVDGHHSAVQGQRARDLRTR